LKIKQIPRRDSDRSRRRLPLPFSCPFRATEMGMSTTWLP
jgi:hypothetical protein